MNKNQTPKSHAENIGKSRKIDPKGEQKTHQKRKKGPSPTAPDGPREVFLAGAGPTFTFLSFSVSQGPSWDTFWVFFHLPRSLLGRISVLSLSPERPETLTSQTPHATQHTRPKIVPIIYENHT